MPTLLLTNDDGIQCCVATGLALEQAGLQQHTPKAQGKYRWVRHTAIHDSAALAESLDSYGISLAPGRIFRPDGQATAWFRVNVAASMEGLQKALLRM